MRKNDIEKIERDNKTAKSETKRTKFIRFNHFYARKPQRISRLCVFNGIPLKVMRFDGTRAKWLDRKFSAESKPTAIYASIKTAFISATLHINNKPTLP